MEPLPGWCTLLADCSRGTTLPWCHMFSCMAVTKDVCRQGAAQILPALSTMPKKNMYRALHHIPVPDV